MAQLQEFLGHCLRILHEASPYITTLSVLTLSISAMIAARQLRATREIHDYQYHLTTRRNTLDYSISRNPAYRDARLAVENAFGVMADRQAPVTFEDVQQAAERYPNIDNDIRTLLSNYENLALAIHAKVADDDVAFELLGASFLKTTGIFMPYIEHRRSERPSRYLNLLRLRGKWEKRNPRDIEFYPIYFGNKSNPRKRRVQ